MKYFNKMFIVLILLIFTIGFVSATDVPDFKCPNTFEKTEDGSYINDMGQGIVVYKYDDSSKSLFLSNHDQYGVEYYENNYYVFVDNENNLGGLLEVVDYNSNKYIVISTILLDNFESESGYVQENLEEFNKLNDVDPLTV